MQVEDPILQSRPKQEQFQVHQKRKETSQPKLTKQLPLITQSHKTLTKMYELLKMQRSPRPLIHQLSQRLMPQVLRANDRQTDQIIPSVRQWYPTWWFFKFIDHESCTFSRWESYTSSNFWTWVSFFAKAKSKIPNWYFFAYIGKDLPSVRSRRCSRVAEPRWCAKG